MGEKKSFEGLLKDLGEDFKVKWNDKSVKKVNYLPHIILNRLRHAIFERDHTSAENLIENYSHLEEACRNIYIFFGEKVRKDFSNQKAIFEKLEERGYFEINGKVKRPYEKSFN